MKQLREIYFCNKSYYTSCGLFICGTVLLLLLFSKAQGFILLNNHHSFALNVFFVNYTFLGDGIFSIALILLLLYRKQKKLALLILAAFLSSGLAAQIIKNIIYAPRPRIYFEASQYIYHLDNFGNSGGGYSSFPSGHTTSAFALATVLSLVLKNKWAGFLLATGAILVGYSRIYLAQHFPADVLAGAIAGITFGTATVLLAPKVKAVRLFKKAKYTKPNWDNSVPNTALS